MAGLKRLLSSRCTAFERELLQAGASERPPLGTQRRMAAALGVSPLVFYVSVARAFLGSALVKAGFGAVVVTGMTVATLDGWDQAQDALPLEPALHVASPVRAPRSSVPVPTASPRSTANESMSSDQGVRPASLVPSVRRTTTRVAHAARRPVPNTLAAEVLLLDRARALIKIGQHEHALRRLDQYRRRFPSGVLARESELLRDRLRR